MLGKSLLHDVVSRRASHGPLEPNFHPGDVRNWPITSVKNTYHATCGQERDIFAGTKDSTYGISKLGDSQSQIKHMSSRTESLWHILIAEWFPASIILPYQ